MNLCFVIFPKVRDKNEPINQTINQTHKQKTSNTVGENKIQIFPVFNSKFLLPILFLEF